MQQKKKHFTPSYSPGEQTMVTIIRPMKFGDHKPTQRTVRPLAQQEELITGYCQILCEADQVNARSGCLGQKPQTT